MRARVSLSEGNGQFAMTSTNGSWKFVWWFKHHLTINSPLLSPHFTINKNHFISSLSCTASFPLAPPSGCLRPASFSSTRVGPGRGFGATVSSWLPECFIMLMPDSEPCQLMVSDVSLMIDLAWWLIISKNGEPGWSLMVKYIPGWWLISWWTMARWWLNYGGRPFILVNSGKKVLFHTGWW